MFDAESANFQRHARLECVRIPAITNADIHALSRLTSF
jgi:hypothetical protein